MAAAKIKKNCKLENENNRAQSSALDYIDKRKIVKALRDRKNNTKEMRTGELGISMYENNTIEESESPPTRQLIHTPPHRTEYAHFLCIAYANID